MTILGKDSNEKVATKYNASTLHVINGTGPEIQFNITDSSNETTTCNQIAEIETVIANATLGFEKIFAINLPSRSDRRDILFLMSAYQGIKPDWQDAVKGDDLDERAWPPHWNVGGKGLKMAELGLWRSHVNVLQKIVEEGYSKALIFEDDVDWDVSLSQQLVEVAQRLRILPSPTDSLAQQSSANSTHGPYSLNWDILWLGTCANPAAPEEAQWYEGPVSSNSQVLWYVPDGIACTWPYAITQEGARMLLGFSLDINHPLDLHYGHFCNEHNCALVWPILISFHEPVGSTRKASDVNHAGTAVPSPDDFRYKAESKEIRHSAILNMLDKVSPI